MFSFGLKLHGVCVCKFLSAIVDRPEHVIRRLFLPSFSVALNIKISLDLLERYLR